MSLRARTRCVTLLAIAAISAIASAITVPESAVAEGLVAPTSGERFLTTDTIIDLSADGSIALVGNASASRATVQTKAGGLRTNLPAGIPAAHLSSDGKSVTFGTTAAKLPTDTDGVFDVYRYAVATSAWTNLTASLALPTDWKATALIDASGDGSTLVLRAYNEAIPLERVVLFNVISKVARFPDTRIDNRVNRSSSHAFVSRDGRTAALLSHPSMGGPAALFRYSWTTNSATRLSGPLSDFDEQTSLSPDVGAISDNGRFILFASPLAGVLPETFSTGLGLYLADLTTGVKRLVANNLAEITSFTEQPSISDNGRHIATRVLSTTRIGTVESDQAQPVVIDRYADHEIQLGRPDSDSTPPNGRGITARVSANGLVAAFTTRADNFATGAVKGGGSFVWPPPNAPALPARLLDTANALGTIDGAYAGGGPIAANTTRSVLIGGRAALPANGQVVVFNVTARGTGAPGRLVVHPCRAPVPSSPAMYVPASASHSTTIATRLSSTGRICLSPLGAAAHVTVDVIGLQPSTSTYRSVVPARLMDTRSTGTTIDGVAQRIGVRRTGVTTRVQLSGRGGLRTGARAVVLHVTSVGAASAGSIAITDCSAAPRPPINISYPATAAAAAPTIVRTNTSGQVCITTTSNVHVIVDGVGEWPATAEFVGRGVAPRLLDSRANGFTIDGRQVGPGIHPGGTVRRVPIGGRASIPTTGVVVALNVTALDAARAGFLTLYGCGRQPATTHVSFARGVKVNNLVLIRLPADGKICLYASADTNVIIELLGYLRGA